MTERPSELIVVIVLFGFFGIAWMGAGLLFGTLFSLVSESAGGSLFPFGIVIGLLMLVIAGGFFGIAWKGAGLLFGALFSPGSEFVGVSLLLFGIVIGLFIWVIAGGLFFTQSWAHTISLVISGISLLYFPIGTVLGGICLWLLFTDQAKASINAA
jgi:hypothetical protein